MTNQCKRQNICQITEEESITSMFLLHKITYMRKTKKAQDKTLCLVGCLATIHYHSKSITKLRISANTKYRIIPINSLKFILKMNWAITNRWRCFPFQQLVLSSLILPANSTSLILMIFQRKLITIIKDDLIKYYYLSTTFKFKYIPI